MEWVYSYNPGAGTGREGGRGKAREEVGRGRRVGGEEGRGGTEWGKGKEGRKKERKLKNPAYKHEICIDAVTQTDTKKQ